MSLVIHIGQPKAASTSIQRALWVNRDQLRAAGVVYPAVAREQNEPQVMDLVWPYFEDRQEKWRRLLERQHLNRIPGGWADLCREVSQSPHAIVSAEVLSLCDARLASRVVSDLAGDQRPRILLCVRQPSAALPSSYAQLAQVQPTVGFETWLRSTLHFALLGDDVFRARMPSLANPSLHDAWGPVADVHEAHLSDSREQFEADVLRILGIEELVSRPFLPRINVSPSAARVVAWQRLLPQRPPWRVLRDAIRRDDLSESLPNRGGRFSLQQEAALLVDEAFPTRAEAFAGAASAKQALSERLRDAAPVSDVGMPADAFEHAVQACLADFRGRLE